MDKSRRNAGFTMLEVLVSIFIMTLGLLGLAGLQVRAQQAELESYQRAQALILLQDMADRINANRRAALCYNFTTNTTTGSPFAGGGSGVSAPVCGPFGTIPTRARADADLAEWHATLNGAAEQLGANQVGAMVGARGCVSLDTSVAPNIYRVSVAWQGNVKTKDPTTVDGTLTCGTGQYGDEAQRRVVALTFPMACLNC
jgi:type IV pilus assembly protein PilV